jgi:hypothetical protein
MSKLLIFNLESCAPATAATQRESSSAAWLSPQDMYNYFVMHRNMQHLMASLIMYTSIKILHYSLRKVAMPKAEDKSCWLLENTPPAYSKFCEVHTLFTPGMKSHYWLIIFSFWVNWLIAMWCTTPIIQMPKYLGHSKCWSSKDLIIAR